MKPLFLNKICLSAAILLMAATANAVPNTFANNETAEIKRFLQRNFADRDYGIVVGFIDEKGSKVIGAGHLDNTRGSQVNGDTIFEIGSITKTFTSLLYLDMVRRGELEKDAPISRYLPANIEVPAYDGREITLMNLAAQDSGLPFNADNHVPNAGIEGLNAYTADDLYVFLSKYHLTQMPGNKFQYSNIGMALLGHIMERQSGVDYESLVVDRICGPLNMHDTRITLTPGQRSRLATGHGADGEPAPYYNFQVMQPAGSFHSTAYDLLKYLSAQLGLTETGLTPVIMQSHMILHESDPYFGDSAIPWVNRGVYVPVGSRLLGHAGGTAGQSTFIGFDLQKKRGVVVLTNEKIVQSGKRQWIAEAIGWTLLQGYPLTPERGAKLLHEVTGYGFFLGQDRETGLISIEKVFPESPASRMGIKAGLSIISINGVSTKNKSLQEGLALMRGPVGTKIRLELAGTNPDDVKVVEMTKKKFLALF